MSPPTSPPQPNDPMDRLTEQARIRGDSRMIPEGKDADAVTPQIAAQVLKNIADYKREKALTFRQIAKGIGKAEATLSQVMSGKYQGDTRSIILDLDRWLDDQVRIDLAPKPASFVWTSIAREIETVARAAVELKTIALIYGPETSGLGKTTALQAIAAERPGCIFITVDKVGANTNGILMAICQQLRIGWGANHAYVFDRIRQALKGTSRLLIVDQVHSLCGARGDKPMHVLSELWEKTGAPQVWAGTSDVVAYLRRTQAKGDDKVTQIRTRIGIMRDLTQRLRGHGSPGKGGKGDQPLYTIDEIRAIFGNNKMRLAPDAARYLCRLANVPDSGALRTCKNLVVMATMLYQDRHQLLTEELLRGAHQLLVPDHAYTLLQAEIEQNNAIRKVG